MIINEQGQQCGIGVRGLRFMLHGNHHGDHGYHYGNHHGNYGNHHGNHGNHQGLDVRKTERQDGQTDR